MSELARCPKKRCRSPLVLNVDGIGRVIYTCPPCDRNRAGFCRRCPNRLRVASGNPAKWCPDCKVIVVRERSAQRDRRPYRAMLAAQPGYKEARAIAAREWRRLHPRDGYDRAYDTAKSAKRSADPVKRAHDSAARRKRQRLAA